MAEINKDKIEGALKFNEIFKELGIGYQGGILGKIGDSFIDLNVRATQVNTTFFQNRERISEIKRTIADATPSVAMFGGQLEDVSRTLSEVAEASNRNVLLSVEQVGKLFGASKILGKSVEEITDSFLDVGKQLNNITDDIEKSINYIQSIGGNAKDVMRDVLRNTENLNKFNFENGVMGLTRMAAKAALLRIDMQQTFNFAEGLASPEKAIEMASTFQRLGVAAGTLVDPFALMYKSIMDPEGLQNALVDLSKRFVEFNAETGNFNINPAGILQMRELAQQAGIGFDQFAKMALSSAELDKRISEISFEYKGSEEDLMFLANMAQFKGGEYVVTIRGEEKALREVTAQEFAELKKVQEESPKTLEDIARGQMNVQDNILATTRAIAQKILLGVTSQDVLQNLAEDLRQGLRTTGKILYEGTPEVSQLRDVFSEPVEYLKDTAALLLKGATTGRLSEEEVSRNEKMQEDFLNNFLGKLGGTFSQTMSTSVSEALSKMNEDRPSDKFIKDLITQNMGMLNNIGIKDVDLIERLETKTVEQNINSNISVQGQINHKVDVPVGVNSDELNRILNNVFNSEDFKKQIRDIYRDIPKQSVTGE